MHRKAIGSRRVFVIRRDHSIRSLNNGGEILPAKMNAAARYINFHQYQQKYHSHFKNQCEHGKHSYKGLYPLKFDMFIINCYCNPNIICIYF